MYAVEFEADVKKNMIQIPIKYKELYSKHIRVIAMISDDDKLVTKTVSESNELEEEKFHAANYNMAIEENTIEDKIWKKYL